MPRIKRNLTEGNIRKQLIELTWPMMMGMMGMVIFNLTDTFFVGQLGVNELAAMSFSFPIVMFLNSISRGIGVGTSSLISRNIIQTDREEVRKMATRSIFLGLLIVLVFVIIGQLTIRPLFTALGAENEVLDFIADYMRVWYFGVLFVVMPMIGNNIIRATGDTFTPGTIMVVIAVVNIVIDPLMIFGIGPFPRLGIKGAALATVIARCMGFIAVLYILIKREKLLTWRIGPLRSIFSTWSKVLYIAGPASLGMLITPISIGLITKILATYGKETVAAFGVGSRIEIFALMVIMALSSVLVFFVGQNFSKQKFERIRKVLNLSMRFSLLWGIIVYGILLVLGTSIASLFTDDTMVIEIARKYFYIVGASYGLYGLVILCSSGFNGLNKPLPSTFFSILRMLILYVPLAWLGSSIWGIKGVFFAGLFANLSVGLLSSRYLFKTINSIQKKAVN